MIEYESQKKDNSEAVVAKTSSEGKQIHIALLTDIGEVVKLLQEDRRKIMGRIKETEEEALRLKMANDESNRQLRDLEESKSRAQLELTKAKINADILKSAAGTQLSKKDAEEEALARELEQIRNEKEEMTHMIAQLRLAKIEMESKLQESAVEAQRLDQERKVSTKKLVKQEIARVEEQRRLRKLQSDSVDLELKLMHAEEGLLLAEWEKDLALAGKETATVKLKSAKVLDDSNHSECAMEEEMLHQRSLSILSCSTSSRRSLSRGSRGSRSSAGRSLQLDSDSSSGSSESFAEFDEEVDGDLAFLDPGFRARMYFEEQRQFNSTSDLQVDMVGYGDRSRYGDYRLSMSLSNLGDADIEIGQPTRSGMSLTTGRSNRRASHQDLGPRPTTTFPGHSRASYQGRDPPVGDLRQNRR